MSPAYQEGNSSHPVLQNYHHIHHHHFFRHHCIVTTTMIIIIIHSRYMSLPLLPAVMCFFMAGSLLLENHHHLYHHDRYHHHLYHHDRHPPKNKECSLILTPSSALALFHQVNAVRHHRNTNVIVFKIENNKLETNSRIFLIFDFTFTDQFPERFYWVAFLNYSIWFSVPEEPEPKPLLQEIFNVDHSSLTFLFGTQW